MKLGEFIENFVEKNSIIRLVYNDNNDHIIVLDTWNDVSMEWEILKGKGDNRHYINNEVFGIASILVAGPYSEAINIIIEKLKNQPFIEELIDE
jgi:CTP-dependent riboflavin kinase